MTSLIRYVPVSEASMAHRLPLMLPFREGDQNPSAGGDGWGGGGGDGDGSGDGTGGGGGGSGGGLGGGRSGTASGEYSTRCGGSSSSAGGGGGGGGSSDGTTAVNVNVDGTTAVLTVGTIVTARWKARGSKWFGARVRTINDGGTFGIVYDDGDEDHKVSR